MSPKRVKISNDKYIVAREILSRLGDAWSVLVIQKTVDKPIRFAELKRRIEEIQPISSRILTRTLKQLERDGLISRKVLSLVPPRVEYAPTKLGRRFLLFANEIIDWTIEHRADFEVAQREFEAQQSAEEAAQAQPNFRAYRLYRSESKTVT